MTSPISGEACEDESQAPGVPLERLNAEPEDPWIYYRNTILKLQSRV